MLPALCVLSLVLAAPQRVAMHACCQQAHLVSDMGLLFPAYY